jgi:hypothetical protein
MHEINPATSTEINRLHQLATKTATEAVEYAKQAGELLLNVKDQLPYGAFGNWVEQNLTVSARQAQRYMAVAQGKPIPVRELAAKYDSVPKLPRNDTVSDLRNCLSQEELDRLIDGTWVPKWKPQKGHWYTTVTKTGGYFVVPDLEKPDFFHVSHFYSAGHEDDKVFFDGTRWAESADRVEIRLKQFQLAEPDKAIWKMHKETGLSEPFGAPERHGKIKIIAKNGSEKWIGDAP